MARTTRTTGSGVVSVEGSSAATATSTVASAIGTILNGTRDNRGSTASTGTGVGCQCRFTGFGRSSTRDTTGWRSLICTPGSRDATGTTITGRVTGGDSGSTTSTTGLVSDGSFAIDTRGQTARATRAAAEWISELASATGTTNSRAALPGESSHSEDADAG